LKRVLEGEGLCLRIGLEFNALATEEIDADSVPLIIRLQDELSAFIVRPHWAGEILERSFVFL